MNMRSKHMLKSAAGQACINCGRRDGTIVAAHYQGLRSQLLGKGMGIKPHDICVADLCMNCHNLFDSHSAAMGSNPNPQLAKIDQSEQFLFNIMLTLMRRIEQGVIVVKGFDLPFSKEERIEQLKAEIASLLAEDDDD